MERSIYSFNFNDIILHRANNIIAYFTKLSASRRWNAIVYFFLFLFTKLPLHAQYSFFEPAPNYNPKRIRTIIISETITGSAIGLGLNYLWYKKFPHSRFHFFNDNMEWLNMDKLGHATTTYNVAAIQTDLLQWGGIKTGKAAWIGSLTALGFMTLVEIMDGHSSKWGFSKGDMLANIAGCILFEGQQLLWQQQRMGLKYSYHRSIFAQYNPEELGTNGVQRMLKDYNGQTYWFSLNIASFLTANTKFPHWLNLAAGYGAEGMTGASANPLEINGKKLPTFNRYRQAYFSFDTDLYRINKASPAAVTLLQFNQVFKLPAPTLEWDAGKKPIVKLFYF